MAASCPIDHLLAKAEVPIAGKEAGRCGREHASRQDGGVTLHQDLLGGPPPTLLPEDPAPAAELAEGGDPHQVAADYPTSSLAWAVLADAAWDQGRTIDSYALARTGYHRGLDALRRNGWKGHGPVPWEHAPNRGFLMALNALARAADAINETDEAARCSQFLADSSPTAAQVLAGA